MPTIAAPALASSTGSTLSPFPDPEVIRLLHRAGGPTPPRVRCSCCKATSDRRDPPGWLTANPVVDLCLRSGFGVCPACLTRVFDFPTDD